jgi:hypothetical protein
MNLKDIKHVINEMAGKMPESSRALLAGKFGELLMKDLTGPLTDASIKVSDAGTIVGEFIENCYLRTGPPNCPSNINIHDTDLAAFINRWMAADQWQTTGDGRKDWAPLTQDMKDLRETMLGELNDIYQAQKRMTDHDNASDNDTKIQAP